MNTEQSYVGRGCHASPTNQTVKKVTPAANTKVETSTPVYNRNYYEEWLDCAKESTTEKLAEYFFGGSSDQIQAINHLLFHWLTTATDLELDQGEPDHQRLYTTLELVNFLSRLHDQSLFVASVRIDLEAAKQREVNDAK